MDKDLTPRQRNAVVTIHGERFDLMPERTAFRHSTKTLLAADLHWGKSETFQAHGLAIPSTVIDDDLARLSHALTATRAERLLVLGDLIHTPRGVTDAVSAKIERWRQDHPRLSFQVIRGNHDKRFQWPDGWGIEDIGTAVRDGDFLFTHDEPLEDVNAFVWMGHIHPVVELRGGGDRLRLPCFVVEGSQALLPAFSAFTGGASIGGPAEGKRVFAIADSAVIEV